MPYENFEIVHQVNKTYKVREDEEMKSPTKGGVLKQFKTPPSKASSHTKAFLNQLGIGNQIEL
jgi:hypothetical protein